MPNFSCLPRNLDSTVVCMLTKDHWVKEQSPQNKKKQKTLSTCTNVRQIVFEVDMNINCNTSSCTVAPTVLKRALNYIKCLLTKFKSKALKPNNGVALGMAVPVCRSVHHFCPLENCQMQPPLYLTLERCGATGGFHTLAFDKVLLLKYTDALRYPFLQQLLLWRVCILAYFCNEQIKIEWKNFPKRE